MANEIKYGLVDTKPRGASLAFCQDFWAILKTCRVLTPKVWACLGMYYVLTPLGAVLDGASWLLLLRVFASPELSGATGTEGRLVNTVLALFRIPPAGRKLLAFVAALFLVKALIAFTLATLGAVVVAVSRRRIQETCYSSLLRARWTDLRAQNVGRWMGVIMEETPYFNKMLLAAMGGLYAFITGAILIALAFAMDRRLSLFLGMIAIPVWLALRVVYRRQNALSKEQANARQGFGSDINERLTGLYQIKAADEVGAQETLGLRHQPALQSLEIGIGRYIGLLNTFNPLLFSCMLGGYVARSVWLGQPIGADILSLGSVGILAARAAGQLTIIVASFGDLSRLSGSIDPILKILALPPEPPRSPLGEELAAIVIDGASYSAGDRVILRGLTATVERGRVFLLTGPSGAGKTTLANLIAGLIAPTAGRVLYRGVSGKDYPSTERKARIGYVPQDVHLYSGTVRENLDPLGRLSDAELRQSLAAAGAAEFVAAMGGLDAYLAEAGRSISGGERRRLGIAKALAQKADCLILDEITNGLDEKTKTGLLETIDSLAKGHLLIAISHDLAAFSSADKTLFELAPA